LPISPYLAKLRRVIGHDLVLLPSVAVIPRDADGRVLIVRSRESGHWQTIGGAVDPDEAPPDAARREALEEAAVTLEIGAVLAVLGGPEFRTTYANGDQVAYMVCVFEAWIIAGEPHPDRDEISEVAWREPSELSSVDFNRLNRTLIDAVLPVLQGAASQIPPGGIEPPLRP
jgi:8-oxo-dGTP pyrophosphatase MutT (NUDIX family)